VKLCVRLTTFTLASFFANAIIGKVRNKVLIVCLVAGLVSGEAFAFLATANRVVTAAEASQAPLRDAAHRHQMALDEVTAAEAAKPQPFSRDRLVAAEAAKAAADAASRSKASEMGCRKNCADMLTAGAEPGPGNQFGLAGEEGETKPENPPN
jgi:hypothetical protein